MQLQFRLTFAPKKPDPMLASQVVTGLVLADSEKANITVDDVTDKVEFVRWHLEKLTGLRVRIDQIA